MAEKPKDVRKIPVEIPLAGKLITSVDPTQLQPGEFATLKNMRYTDRGISGLKGITKAVTNAIGTYIHVKEGHHFRKAQPAESHVLVQGFNAGDNAARILDNTTAIPTVGDFSGTTLYSTAATLGKFSDWPDSSVSFCDGTNSLIWSGNEMRTGQFINYIPDVDITPTPPDKPWRYDYTTVINNVLTDAKNIATLHRYTTTATFNSADLFSNDGTTANWIAMAAVVDNVSCPGITTLKFDTGAGTPATCPGHVDFATLPTSMTLTIRLLHTAVGTLANQDYFAVVLGPTGGGGFTAKFASDGLFIRYSSSDVEVGTNLVDVSGSVWQKWDFKLNFVTHKCDVYLNDAIPTGGSAIDFDIGSLAGATLTIVQDGTTTGNRITFMDYVQIGTYFYPATSNFTRVKIGAIRPISGVKLYMGGTVNATASVALVQYWNGSNNTLCTNIVDGTRDAGLTKTLTKTGIISFDSTVATAKASIYQNTMAYWYDFIFSGIDDLVTVYFATLVAPMQPVVDIWDGGMRTILQMKLYQTSLEEYTNRVNKDTWVAGDTTTYLEIPVNFYNTCHMYLGFSERQMALLIHFVENKVSADNLTTMIEYWNGSTWVSVGTISDGTYTPVKGTFSKNGIISWNSPADNVEFTTTIGDEIPLYYYRIHFPATFPINVQIYYIAGIPTQKFIHGYKFPTTWQDRPVLCSDQSGEKNSILIGSLGTSCVFNGADSTTLRFGDDTDIIAAEGLFTRYTGAFYESLMVIKQNGIWVVDGTNPGDYKQYEIQSSYGCAAPRTLRVCDLGYEISPGINKLIMVWLSSDGVVAFDGNTVFRIDKDISNYFDKSKTECVNATYIADSFAWYDPVNHSYHIRFASGSQTTPDTEFAFDVVRQKWYEVVRTSQTLRGCFTVTDTYGNMYVYGADNAGFMYRVDYGDSWNGTQIVYTFQTGDLFTPDSLTKEQIRKLVLWAAQKTGGGNITIDYYGNGATTGVTLGTLSIVNATGRIVGADRVFSQGTNITSNSSHSIKVTYTNAVSETAGFLPVRMGWLIEPKHEVY
jgi:hypothetical protein